MYPVNSAALNRNLFIENLANGTGRPFLYSHIPLLEPRPYNFDTLRFPELNALPPHLYNPQVAPLSHDQMALPFPYGNVRPAHLNYPSAQYGDQAMCFPYANPNVPLPRFADAAVPSCPPVVNPVYQLYPPELLTTRVLSSGVAMLQRVPLRALIGVRRTGPGQTQFRPRRSVFSGEPVQRRGPSSNTVTTTRRPSNSEAPPRLPTSNRRLPIPRLEDHVDSNLALVNRRGPYGIYNSDGEAVVQRPIQDQEVMTASRNVIPIARNMQVSHRPSDFPELRSNRVGGDFSSRMRREDDFQEASAQSLGSSSYKESSEQLETGEPSSSSEELIFHFSSDS